MRQKLARNHILLFTYSNSSEKRLFSNELSYTREGLFYPEILDLKILA